MGSSPRLSGLSEVALALTTNTGHGSKGSGSSSSTGTAVPVGVSVLWEFVPPPLTLEVVDNHIVPQHVSE